MTWETELGVALEAAERAAQLCEWVRARQGEAATQKTDQSPVTVADFGSQALICEALSQSFPGVPVIGEEDSAALQQDTGLLDQVRVAVEQARGSTSSDELCGWIDHGTARSGEGRYWTLDPIDGTKGFLRGENYAVALALIDQGQVVLAVVICPWLPTAPDARMRGVIFRAVQGEGSWSRPIHKKGPVRRLRVSGREASQARYCESRDSRHSDQARASRVTRELGITREPLRTDSMAKYGLVARGEADLYMRMPLGGYEEKIWDHAPGILLVQEAGGTVTDLAGSPPRFPGTHKLDVAEGIVASNGCWHDRLIELCQR